MGLWSDPLWNAITTSMATRASVPDLPSQLKRLCFSSLPVCVLTLAHRGLCKEYLQQVFASAYTSKWRTFSNIPNLCGKEPSPAYNSQSSVEYSGYLHRTQCERAVFQHFEHVCVVFTPGLRLATAIRGISRAFRAFIGIKLKPARYLCQCNEQKGT